MKRLLPLIVLSMLSLASCEGLIDIDATKFDKSGKVAYNADEFGNVSLTMPFESSRATIVFNASDNWEAAFSDPDAAQWCNITPSSGGAGETTVFVSAAENKNAERRNVNITLTCVEDVKTISVTQKPVDALALAPERFDIGCEGGFINVKVRSSVSYTVEVDKEAESWIHKADDTKGLITYNIGFNVDRNFDLKSARTGKILFKSSFGTQEVSVSQKVGVPCIVFDKKEYKLPAEGGVIVVKVLSNIDYKYSIKSGYSWLSEVKTGSGEDNVLRFSAGAYEGTTDRKAEIEFTNNNKKVSSTLYILQAKQDYLTVSPRTANVAKGGGTVTVTVNANNDISYEITEGGDMLSFSGKDTTTGGAVFHFTVTKNPYYGMRKAVVTFTAGSKTGTFTISQKG